MLLIHFKLTHQNVVLQEAKKHLTSRRKGREGRGPGAAAGSPTCLTASAPGGNSLKSGCSKPGFATRANSSVLSTCSSASPPTDPHRGLRARPSEVAP